ncbi:hypothetical protein KTT_13990 [Tengunoibacter tsumagoiensis]|uniref:Uncharacterized protein n=2 Tax=Tengunoibacter tsumagoiensis TaxID=2014871 RepID=A0A401ZXG9_9CHLR|nr:hypothetical protein KTT_13990 [Tengunoibacter tsumagoiensis]
MTNTTLSETVDRLLNPQNEAGLDVYRKASLLGLTTGLRSMLPLALLARSEEKLPNPRLKTLTMVLAIGEVIGDKLPTTPSRLKTGPLVGRLIIGAIAGAFLCQRAHQSPVIGAVRGALGAAIGSIAGSAYRSFMPSFTEIPDIFWAAIEDAAAYSLGTCAVTNSENAANAL